MSVIFKCHIGLFFSYLSLLLPKALLPKVDAPAFPRPGGTHTLNCRLPGCHLELLLSWSNLLSPGPFISGSYQDPDISTASSYASNGRELGLTTPSLLYVLFWCFMLWNCFLSHDLPSYHCTSVSSSVKWCLDWLVTSSILLTQEC